jgi:hypothetical protein
VADHLYWAVFWRYQTSVYWKRFSGWYSCYTRQPLPSPISVVLYCRSYNR